MAATNWTIVTRRKDNGIGVTFPLLSKWTYKTAVAIANESTDTSTFEIISVVETNKIMIKNDKEKEKKSKKSIVTGKQRRNIRARVRKRN